MKIIRIYDDKSVLLEKGFPQILKDGLKDAGWQVEYYSISENNKLEMIFPRTEEIVNLKEIVELNETDKEYIMWDVKWRNKTIKNNIIERYKAINKKNSNIDFKFYVYTTYGNLSEQRSEIKELKKAVGEKHVYNRVESIMLKENIIVQEWAYRVVKKLLGE